MKRMGKRGKDIATLQGVINSLLRGDSLEPNHRDHALSGKWKGLRDCHVEPDWVLIYKQRGSELILFRTGTHSDLGI